MPGKEVLDRRHREDEGGRKRKDCRRRRRIGGSCGDLGRVQSTAHGKGRVVIGEAENRGLNGGVAEEEEVCGAEISVVDELSGG